MDLKNRKILITGGAGFIGSHLAERLGAQNTIRILDDFSTGSMENLSSLQSRRDVDVIEGSVTDPFAVRAACRGMDVVFHLAVSCLRTSLADPRASHDVNAGGTLSACRAAMACGVERFVYVSSSEVYGTAKQAPMDESHPCEPITVYGGSKLAGEHYALACYRTYGLPVVIVRPFNTYGPREPWQGRRAEVIPRFILRAMAGKPPVVFGDGTQTRDFTYVDDTVAGIVKAGACDELVGDVINVARGEEVSIADVARSILDALGAAQEPIFAPSRPGDVFRHLADISKARTLMAYDPKIGFDDGLSRCVQWFQQQTHEPILVGADAGAPNW